MMPKRKYAIYSVIFAILAGALGAWFADIGGYSANVISFAGYALMLLALGLLADSARRLFASQW